MQSDCTENNASLSETTISSCAGQCERCFVELGGKVGNEDITHSVIELDQGHLKELLLRRTVLWVFPSWRDNS